MTSLVLEGGGDDDGGGGGGDEGGGGGGAAAAAGWRGGEGLGRGGGNIELSVWDLGGQPRYAAAQQQYLAPGSLYVLVVPALPLAELGRRADDLPRPLGYLRMSARARCC